MKRHLDATDERILQMLTANARISHARIATRIGLSRNAVRQRVERLEAAGIIRGYTLVPSKAADGPARLAALIFVYRHDRLRGGDVILAIRSIPEIVACDVLSGDYDLALRVEVDDADRIRQIWQQLSSMPSVRDTVTAVVLSSLVNGLPTLT